MINLTAENMSLEYPTTGPSKTDTQTDVGTSVGGRFIKKGKFTYIRALNNVSFSLKEGDRLGLVGNNGAGKSTLLRVLAGIYLPTSGKVICNGRRGNALNVNLGWRPELTARDNLQLRALMNGLRGDEITRLIDQITEESETRAFLDEPLRTYSAGMRSRLTFCLTTYFDYDILLLDEWIGAGDRPFQNFVADRIKKFTNVKILVFASHNHKMVGSICNKYANMSAGQFQYVNQID